MVDLEDVLEFHLSNPPAKAGMRVLSDRDLAPMFGVDRMRMRRLLDRFAERGILSRRPGSGTFIRKVPDRAIKLDPHSLPDHLRNIQSESLFAAPATISLRRQPMPDQQQLSIGLWSDLLSTTSTNSLLFRGIGDRISETGHNLVSGSIVDKTGKPLSADRLSELLQARICDAYIVVSNWTPLFQEALKTRRPPMVFLYGASTTDRYQPLVHCDTDAGIRRAVQIFADQGLKRIAHIGAVSHQNDGRHDNRVYEREMEDCGLSYRGWAKVSQPWEKAAETSSEVRKLLSGSNRPQAVYVSNDHLVAGVARQAAQCGLTIGRDLALICLANRGSSLVSQDSTHWSKLEYDPALLGRMVVDSLLRVVRSAGHELASFSHQPTWVPGRTHLYRS